MRYICPNCLMEITESDYNNGKCHICEGKVPNDQSIQKKANALVDDIDTNLFTNILLDSNDLLKEYPNNYYANYLNAYARYELNDTTSLLSFFNNVRVKAPKVVGEAICDHIITYLTDRRIKKAVETYIVNRKEIDVIPFLFDYYELSLHISIEEIEKKNDVIIIYATGSENLAYNIKSDLNRFDNTCYLEDSDKDLYTEYYVYLDGLIKNAKKVLFINSSSELSDKMLGLNNIANQYHVPCYLLSDRKSCGIFEKVMPINEQTRMIDYMVNGPKIYEITLENNGTIVKTYSIEEDNVYPEFPVLTLKGHKFKGWYYNNSLITPGSKLSVTSNHTLKASFEKNVITIKFDGNGGVTSTRSMKIEYGQIVSELPVPKYKGKEFLGWSTQLNGNYAPKNISEFEVDTTLYAQWADKVYLVWPEANGGYTTINELKVKDGDNTSVLPVPTKKDYNFKGWYLDKDLKKPLKTKFELEENIYVYAKWEAIPKEKPVPKEKPIAPNQNNIDNRINEINTNTKNTTTATKIINNATKEYREYGKDKYYGQMKDGKFNGNGKYTWENGSWYDGEWVNHHRNGYGIYNYANGNRYEGNWANDEKDGYGEFYFSNKDVYKGSFKNGVKEGKGKYIWANGNVYNGDWVNGNMEGMGKYSYASGGEYTGQFKNDLRNGKGFYLFKSGNTYDGMWKDGKQDGYGVFTYKSGDKYEGNWVNDIKSGMGKYTWKSGSIYNGEWKNGNMEGQGTYYYADGDKFSGTYVNDKRNGFGVYYYKDGCRYEGPFVDGKRDGTGTYYTANGSSRRITYRNGVEI